MKTRFAIAMLAVAMLCIPVMAQEKTAESWYKSGQELERTGAWQAAIDAYDQAIKQNPEYKEAWCAKCKALSNVNLELSGEGQNITFTDAIQACDKALDIDPKSARSWSGKGFVLYQEFIVTTDPGKLNESLQAYEKAIEVGGSDTSALTEAWRGKGTALSQMGRSGEALAAQEKAIELNESDVEAWMGKAMALSKLGRDEEAVQAYDRIFELYQSEEQRIFDYPYIWYAKGRALEKLGRDEEAAHAYNRSIEDVDTIIGWVASGREFYMNLSEAWQYKGQLLEEQGRYEEAVEALDNATRVNPESQRDWHRLGSILARDLGRYNQSLEAYDRALQLDPRDGDTLTGKANVLRSLGRYDEALEHYEKVLQLDMQSPYSFHYMAESWLGKGEILRMQGKYNESFLAYDKALELDPRYPEDVWIGRGRLLDSMGRHSEAQEEYNQSFLSYREVAKNNSRRCDIWHGLGNALLGLNRYEEAQKAYDNATRLNPNYAEAWFDKGLALLALNRDAEADAAFAIARKVGYSAEPQILRAPPVVTNVTSLGDDEFIELANNETVAQGFRNLRLIADGDENNSIVLPDFTLEPGQKIRIHFGQGESNQTDLYLGSEIDLNDTAGNLTLRDSIRGIETGYMEYWTPPAQENAAEYWLEKGQELGRNGSYEEAVKAYDNVLELDEKNAEAWLGKGTILSLWAGSINDEALYEDAIKAFDKAIDLDPQQTRGRLVKANALLNLGRYNESLEILDEAIEAASRDTEKAQIWFEKAHLFAEQGNYNETAKALEKASLLDPKDKDLWINGGVLLSAHLGRYDEALKYYERALQIDSADSYAWYDKGEALKALGRTAEADAAFAKAKELGYSDSAKAQESTSQNWYQKAQELARNGSFIDAVKAYDRAIDLDPGNLDARMNKAMALHQAGRLNESIAAQDDAVQAAIRYLDDLNQSVQAFNKAIEAVTSNSPAELAEAWDQRGFILADLAGPLDENKSTYEEAIKYFDRAAELDPQRKEAWIFKGSVLDTRLNRSDEALLAYDKAIELDGANAGDNESLSNAWSGKGTALAKLGRYNESFEAFDKAIELSPQAAAFVWLSKGDALNQSGRYEEAAEAYDEVVEQNLDSTKALTAHAYGSKGDALSALGKYDEAVKAYDEAIEQYPLDSMGAQAWYKKGLALKALGRQAEADASNVRAKELGYKA